MEQLKNENVSVKSDSLNRGCTKKLVFRDAIGCKFTDSYGFVFVRYCEECRAGKCPDFFVCNFDNPMFRPESLEPVFLKED